MSDPLPSDLTKRFPRTDDRILRRFLIARGGDANAAAEMYQAHLEWRKTVPADLRSAALQELKKGKFTIRGRDRYGHPIIHWRTKFNDPDTRDLNEAVWAVVYLAEMLTEKEDASNPDGMATVIVDRTDGIPDLALVKQLAGVMQKNYPERLHVGYVLPVNMVARGIWATVKYFFDAKTRSKFVLLPGPETLLEHVLPDELPVRLGGKDTWEFDPEKDLK